MGGPVGALDPPGTGAPGALLAVTPGLVAEVLVSLVAPGVPDKGVAVADGLPGVPTEDAVAAAEGLAAVGAVPPSTGARAAGLVPRAVDAAGGAEVEVGAPELGAAVSPAALGTNTTASPCFTGRLSESTLHEADCSAA